MLQTARLRDSRSPASPSVPNSRVTCISLGMLQLAPRPLAVVVQSKPYPARNPGTEAPVCFPLPPRQCTPPIARLQAPSTLWICETRTQATPDQNPCVADPFRRATRTVLKAHQRRDCGRQSGQRSKVGIQPAGLVDGRHLSEGHCQLRPHEPQHDGGVLAVAPDHAHGQPLLVLVEPLAYYPELVPPQELVCALEPADLQRLEVEGYEQERRD